MEISFDEGSLLLDAPASASMPAFLSWDKRVRRWRCLAAFYTAVRALARQRGLEPRAAFHPFPSIRLRPAARLDPLRDFQSEAVEAWRHERGRGVVVLPTGSGKTRLALEAIARTGRSCLVVVPTLELLAQWYGILSDAFEGEVGRLGGGEHEVAPLTVTTYDSAYRWIDRYGDRFALLVFDEAHHLPAPTYVQIAQLAVAPFRLGLTATLERADFAHVVLADLLGPIVYRRSIDELSGEALAEYRTEVRTVRLTPEEESDFAREDSAYREALRSEGLRGRQAFEGLLDLAGRSESARVGLAAYRTARRILNGAAAKIDIVGDLLRRHADAKFLIFTEYNDLVYRLSREYLIPPVTHLTSPKERRWILRAFKEGRVRALVTSKVLNEGVDVPEANVALVLGGSGSRREHVQRLGRILRPAPGKEALLIEVITSAERGSSYRRRMDSAFRRSNRAQRELFCDADG